MWQRRSLILGASRERAGLFTLIGAGLFMGGFLLGDHPGRLGSNILGLGVTLLVLTLVLSAFQAYLNGSTALAVLLSAAPPVGFLAQSMHWPPFPLTVLHLGLAVGLLFGVTGHLLGSQLATIREAAPEPSYRGQVALAALMFVVLGSYVLSSGNI